MSNDAETAETITAEDHPGERVRIVYDYEPREPYGDAMAAALYTDGEWCEWASEVYQPTDADEIAAAWKHYAGGWRHYPSRPDRFTLFERWLRICQGTTAFHAIQTRDNAILIFDTADYRAHAGITAEILAEAGEKLLAGEVAEWQAMVSGDVYGIVHERHRTGHTVWSTGEESDIEDWQVVESVWGFFGFDDTLAEARSWLGITTGTDVAS